MQKLSLLILYLQNIIIEVESKITVIDLSANTILQLLESIFAKYYNKFIF